MIGAMTKTNRRVPRFAEGTKVSIAQSKAEIEHLLQAHRASAIGTMWDRIEGGRLFFRMGNGAQARMCRLDVPPVMQDPKRKLVTPVQIEKEERRRWRALLLRLKAHLEAITGGDATIEQELMGYLVLPSGATVAEAAGPELAQAYETGVNPPLMLGAGPKPRTRAP
jgi:hypothetical protein